MSDGLTAAALISTSTWPSAAETVCRSIDGATAATSAAFSRRRRQRASTERAGVDGLEIIVIQDLRNLMRRSRRAGLPDRFWGGNLRRPGAHGQQIVACDRLAVLVEHLDVPAHL